MVALKFCNTSAFDNCLLYIDTEPIDPFIGIVVGVAEPIIVLPETPDGTFVCTLELTSVPLTCDLIDVPLYEIV